MRSKGIYPKYYKHWSYTVAHTINCVCSKMLNHGWTHGVISFTFQAYTPPHTSNCICVSLFNVCKHDEQPLWLLLTKSKTFWIVLTNHKLNMDVFCFRKNHTMNDPIFGTCVYRFRFTIFVLDLFVPLRFSIPGLKLRSFKLHGGRL